VRWLESLAAEAISLDAYLRAIARFPELTTTEERHLAERVQRKDDDALARLVASQLALVLRYAQRYQVLGIPLADLVHDGNLALVDAARRFDPDRHGRFATYALWWIRQGVFHRLCQPMTTGGAPDPDSRAASLAAALQVVVEHACSSRSAEGGGVLAEAGRGLDVSWRLTPEIERLDDDELDLDDVGALLVDDGQDAVRGALASDLGLSLLELEPKERRALELRLGLADGEPRSVAQIGDRLRLSPARVERLSARAVQKLRRQRSVRSSLN
jgi:RNA polymerase primary sigma factor